MDARVKMGPGRVAWTSQGLRGVKRVFRVDGRFDGGLEKVDGPCSGALPTPGDVLSGERRVSVAVVGVGGWVDEAIGVGEEINSAS